MFGGSGECKAFRKKYGSKWGRCREPIDLLDRPSKMDGSSGLVCEVMFNWFTPFGGRCKFKYNLCDLQWIDLDCIISTMNLFVEPSNTALCILHDHDANLLDNFVKNQM